MYMWNISVKLLTSNHSGNSFTFCKSQKLNPERNIQHKFKIVYTHLFLGNEILLTLP